MSWKSFQKGLYDYYCSKTENPKSVEEFLNEIVEYKDRKDKYIVYFGYSKKDKDHKTPIYVGTTIQHPMSRWYYHSTHGKDLDFVEMFRFNNSEEMLEKEYELIKKYHPSCNKITKRKQNLNVELTPEVIESRKGSDEWCQCCYRRRVNKGYRYCYYCSTGRK
jgi:hypothetical protein